MCQKLYWKPLVVPAELKAYTNGKLPEEQLGRLSCGGTAWKGGKCGGAVFSFNLMFDHAKREGIILDAVSEGYRSYERQLALFLDRYQLTPTGRVPEITRTWNGATWYLKQGKSPSASPQTSPHGWALAQDLDVRDRRVYDWLVKNAPKYGWFLQGPPTYNGKPNPEYEAWHWQLSNADKPTRRVRKAWRKFQNMVRKAQGV